MTTPDAAVARRFTPRDPETFFKAQKRNRRATWRMSALSAFAALVMGIPLTLVLTPLLYAVALVTAEIVNHFSPLPADFWRSAQDLASLGTRIGDYYINNKGTLHPGELTQGAILFLLPGILAASGLWLGVLMMFRRGGVGGALASLNAREPNQADLKELQLADVVQEMAIAAGLPAPKMMLIDSPGANAAAIGSDEHDARIVISRRLLDDLDRDQLQAVLANLVGSISNGDLQIAFKVTSVFETCGFIVNLINLPFGKSSRAVMWKVLRYLFGRGTPEERAMLAAEIAESLATSLDTGSTDTSSFMDNKHKTFLQKVIGVVFFPLIFTNLAVELTLWVFMSCLVGPCMALLWRTRCYLADATSVEFTRNPDAMALALQRLSEDTNAVEGGEWASHLFLVDPKGDVSMRTGVVPEQQKQLFMKAWTETEHLAPPAGTAAATSAPADFLQVRAEMMSLGKRAMTGDAHAIARLQAIATVMGANPALGVANMPTPADLMAARQGDPAALARLQKLGQVRQGVGGKRGQSGLQMVSIMSFHPPLKRRAKKLQRLGSHILAPGGYGLGTKIFMTILWLIIGPLLTVAGGMMLLVIAMMVMLNLVFLTLWLSIIHAIFTFLNSR